MSPDPFRALDRIDPPDHWDEITRRAGSDDVVVDLGDGPSIRPRHRPAVMVATAAAIAIMAGVVVAGVGADLDDGVTANSAPIPRGPGEGCAFHLELDEGGIVLAPGLPEVEAAAEQPTGLPRALPSAGHATIDGRTVIVSVGDDPDPTPRVGTGRGLLPDGSHRSWLASARPLDEGAGPAIDGCGDAVVHVDITDMEVADALIVDEDEPGEEPIDGAAAVRDGPLAPIGALADRLLDAIRLDPAADDPADDCAAPGPAPERGDEPEGVGDRFGGTLGDGRTFEVVLTADGYETTIEGEGTNSSGGGPGTIHFGSSWGLTGEGRGLAVGVRPPGALRTYALTRDDEVVCAGIVFSPDRRWFALPEVERNWYLVHEDADGNPIGGTVCQFDADCPGGVMEGTTTTTTAATRADDEDLSEEIDREAQAHQERLVCEAEPAACPDDVAWEGSLPDGRTYRVEVQDDDVRLLVDGESVSAVVDAAPSWTDPARGPGVWIPLDDGDDLYQAVVVGARPAGAVETVILGPDGDERDAPSLQVSPDGRFASVAADDLRPDEEGAEPLALRHRGADGQLFPVVP